jgi:zinc protease
MKSPVINKKTLLQVGLFCAFSLMLCLPMSAQKHPSDLPEPEPLTFNPPQPEIVILENGMVLYLLEDHELPLFTAKAYIRTGSIYEPGDKAGLAALTGSVMRSGGTATRPGDQLDEELAFIAGSVETGIGQSSGTASVSVLAKHIDTGLEIFADVLMNPTFPDDKIELARKRTLSGIRRRNDNPGAIANREFLKQIYGPASPWGRNATAKSVRSITRDDLVAFYSKYFHPNSIMVAISGDFKKEDIVTKFQNAFQGWERAEIDFPEVPKLGEGPEPGVFHVEKDVNQSTVFMGHLGINNLNPDWYGVRIMNRIFAVGTFTSRMGKEIRSARGLAYSVSGGVTRGPDRGPFYIYCQTKAETTVEAIDAMLDVTRKMRKGPILDEEFNFSQNRLINSDVFNYASNSAIVDQKVYYKYHGFPDDYLESYIARTQAVTKADALRIAQQYMDPDRVVIVVVGKEENFDKPLSTLGKVTRIELPPPDGE